MRPSRMMIVFLLLAGCFGYHREDEQPKSAAEKKDPRQISVDIKRINFAYRVCKENGKIKEIVIKPKEIVVCGNGATFSK